MTTLSLETIRDCFDGEIPAIVATCSPDGIPNNSFVSQLHYIDTDHIALTYQFFNKTRQNVLANPATCIWVAHPITAARYTLSARYLRTETEGAVFENMKAKLAGIASHTGMSGVFRLQGADIYRVERIEVVAEPVLPSPAKPSLLTALRNCTQAVQQFGDLETLLGGALAHIETCFDAQHSMIHWLDESGERLYLVASRGYAQSGVGSEIQLGQGVIGVAAKARTSIRITHATSEYTYSRATRESVRDSHLADRLEAEIPLAGLDHPGSQLAVPILLRGRLLGVLSLEAVEEGRFGYDEEDALVAFAQHLALASQMLEHTSDKQDEPLRKADVSMTPPAGTILAVRHYAQDDTIFVEDDYLIKGVAGAILWKLLSEYRNGGRVDFTNRELRLDTALSLPDLSSNLEARLILLQKRLAERCPHIGIVKTGRGRFRLRIDRPVQLLEVN